MTEKVKASNVEQTRRGAQVRQQLGEKMLGSGWTWDGNIVPTDEEDPDAYDQIYKRREALEELKRRGEIRDYKFGAVPAVDESGEPYKCRAASIYIKPIPQKLSASPLS